MTTHRAPQNVWQLMLGYMLGVIPNFMLPPLIILSLVQRGVEPSVIGVVASMQSLGLLVALPLIPLFVRRTTERYVLIGATWMTLLATIGLLVSDALVVWALVSALAGGGAGMRYVIAQSWVTSLAPLNMRGRIVGLFETLLGVSSLAAPSILLITGATGRVPLIIAGLLVIVGLLVILPIRSPQGVQPATPPQPGQRVSGLLSVTVLVAAFLGGLFETGMLTALPLFSTTIHFTAILTTLVVTVVSIGSILQFLFGYLADRFRWQRVLHSTTALVVVAPLLLLLVPAIPGLIWPLGLVLGAAGGGLYTLAIICISTTLRGTQLVRSTTLLAFVYVLGSTLGPIVGGFALDLSPQYGMTIVFVAAGLVGFGVMSNAARSRHVAQVSRGCH